MLWQAHDSARGGLLQALVKGKLCRAAALRMALAEKSVRRVAGKGLRCFAQRKKERTAHWQVRVHSNGSEEGQKKCEIDDKKEQ